MKILCAAVLFSAGLAHADEPAQRAGALFERGRQAFAARDIDAACDAFAASLALDPQLGTRLNLATCRMQQDRLLDAYALFETARAEAAQIGKPARAQFAREQLALLDARLVRLHVVTDGNATVVVNGASIDPTRRQLLRGGRIKIEVTAPGYQPYRIEKVASAGSELTIEIPPLVAIPAPRPPRVEPPPIQTVERPRTRLPYIVGSAGAMLLVAAGGLTLHARSRWHTAYDAMSSDGVTTAQHEADIATALAVAGAVSIGLTWTGTF